jgi:hypothetical protein
MLMRSISVTPWSFLTIDTRDAAIGSHSDLCFQIEISSPGVEHMKMAGRKASGLKTDQRLSSLRSHDARHGRICQQEDLAAEEPQFNVAVVQHGPFRVAVAHELADMDHHERLRRIAVEAASDIIGRCDSSAGLRASRSGVSSAKRKHRLKTFLMLAFDTGEALRAFEQA